MSRLKSFVLFVTLISTSGILIWSCSTKEDLPSNDPNPKLDIRALAEFGQENEFSQVLLRMQLLNSHADLLKHGLSTPEEHQNRLSYYLFGFKDDVALISQGDTIPCYDLHFERTYMDLPYMNFILTFHHSVQEGDEILLYEGIYTQQTLVFSIEPREIQ